jgi:2-oxoacid:acceptor oxidoreductase gamma subunit (pyruvate/2-ketoisovalerate family)
MKEIKIYGRGGQGAVTAAQILATAAFLEGYWAQTFPQFGAERRGAPVLAYVRLDHEPISIRSKVYSPDLVIVMDFNLFKMVKPLEGIQSDGTAIINYQKKGGVLPFQLSDRVAHLYTIDASRIAHQIYGKTAIPITNTIILGAYCSVQDDIALESIYKALPDFFPSDKLEINRRAVQAGFENLRGI